MMIPRMNFRITDRLTKTTEKSMPSRKKRLGPIIVKIPEMISRYPCSGVFLRELNNLADKAPMPIPNIARDKARKANV